jgi:predicted CxxxxCH...CXXCH cytochrome family protein
MKSITLWVTIILFSVAFLAGCSQLKNDSAPTAPTASIHGSGFKDSTSTNFHGLAFRTTLKWNVESCKSCHGQKFDGGTVQKSCLGCHTQSNGPEACNTCHGGVNAAPPSDLSGNTLRTSKSVGAHQAHLAGGKIGAAVACSTCHTVPAKVSDAGHITNGIALVKTETTSIFYRSEASYSSALTTCASTYCHGNFPNGKNKTVLWTDTTGVNSVIACGMCHGDPSNSDPEDRARPKTVSQGGTHPDKDDYKDPSGASLKCYRCHGNVVDANLNIINKALHINGKVN